MFPLNKALCSSTNKLTAFQKLIAQKTLSCRHVKTAPFPRETKTKLGYVVLGGGITLGLSFAYNYIPEHSLCEHLRPAFVLADATRRSQHNCIADVLGDKSLGIVAIDSWLTQDSNRRLYDYGVGFVDEASELVITNEGFLSFHQEKLFQVIFEDGTAHHAKVVSFDNHSDLAALRLCNEEGQVRERGGIPTVKLSSSTPRLGEKLVAVTMLANDSDPSIYKIFSGCLTSLKLKEDDSPLQMSTNAIDGAFGGPVLNADGEVVGVVSIKHHSGAAFSIPYNYVRQFIERTLKHETIIWKKEADIRRQLQEDKEREEERQRKEMEEIIEARKKIASKSDKNQ